MEDFLLQRNGFLMFETTCRSSLPPHTVLAMPALSPTMKTGNIATFKFKVGDKVCCFFGDKLMQNFGAECACASQSALCNCSTAVMKYNGNELSLDEW